jgi:hypothetical protein
MNLSLVVTCGTVLKGHHHSSLLIPIKTTLHQRSALLGILINLAQRGTERKILRAPAFDSAQVACSAVIAMDHPVF